VRDHHDGLAVIAIERLQQIEDLSRRTCDRDRRSARRRAAASGRDDRAGDADALFLSARELAR
jgi:hypothetical protein